MQRRRGRFVRFAVSLRSAATILTSCGDTHAPRETRHWGIARTAGVELFDATSPRYRTRRLLAFPRGRRLGDRESYRALRADGDVSLLHRAHVARQLLLWLQRTRRRGRATDAGDLARRGG